jgi:hypothetical protein
LVIGVKDLADTATGRRTAGDGEGDNRMDRF